MAEEAKTEEKKADVNLSKDAEKILDLVKKLPVMDLANLVKAFEDEFGVSAAPVAVAGAAPAAGGGGGDAGGAEEKSEVTVELATIGDQKIAVIKAVKDLTGLGLKEAKDLVDGAPKAMKYNVPVKEAEEMKKKLEDAGASVELK